MLVQLLVNQLGVPPAINVSTRKEDDDTNGCWANILCIVIPTPSNTARRQAQPIAEFRIDRAPPKINIKYRLWINTSYGQRSSCEKSCYYSTKKWSQPPLTTGEGVGEGGLLPRIFFLSYSLHSTVVSTE